MAENPAHSFFEQYKPNNRVNLQDLIVSYSRFLLSEAGTYTFPVEIEKILHRFGLKLHKVEIPQRGMVTPDLDIWVNFTDKEEVQSFTQGHELTELLVEFVLYYRPKLLSDEDIKDLKDNYRREYWCDVGAANILMPMNFFRNYVENFGYSMLSALSLARSSRLSLSAILRRMLETGLRQTAIIIWHLSHKPNDIVPSEVGQLNIFDNLYAMDPPKKLRVEQSFKSTSFNKHIRKHKSVEEDTTIARAFRSRKGTIVSGFDYLEITTPYKNYKVEAMCTSYGGKDRVLSLVFFDEKQDHQSKIS